MNIEGFKEKSTEKLKGELKSLQIVAGALAMVPFFLGMIVIFPVLGHASWHLYRRAIAPGRQPTEA